MFETGDFAEPFSFSLTQALNLPAGKFYLRGEAQGAGSGLLPEPLLPCCGLTNPIWVEITV
jgi:hypothetical protein